MTLVRNLAIAAAFFAMPAASAFAGEACTAPCAGYAASLELENDWIFAADPPRDSLNDPGPAIDAKFFLTPIDRLKLISAFTIEPVLDKEPGADRTLCTRCDRGERR